MDLSATDREIAIRVELPGLEPDDIEVSVTGSTLTIRGEKREAAEARDGDRCHCERRFGSFRRCVELPAPADVDRIVAECRNGVLTVRVPKIAETSRRIEVNEGHAPSAESTDMVEATF